VRQRDDRSQPPPGTHYTDGLTAGQGAALTPSDFGTFDVENVRAWPKTVEIRVRVDFEMAELSARGEWSEDGRAVCEAEGNPTNPAVSTGVGSQWTRETEPGQAAQLLGRAHEMIATMQVPKAIEAWCENLERYSDFQNRLPRGRTYLRNGSVIDLQIASGEVKALVCGSSVYQVAVKIMPVSKARWKSICKDCAGAIDSLVELLQGRLSRAVMERICREKTGLFPSPKEIQLSCSCPDWAFMCKHIAAVLYGIGARLDKARTPLPASPTG